MDRSVQELRDEFFRLLDQGAAASTPLWQAVWRLFIEHPWYQAELHQATQRVLRRAGVHAQWAGDLEQDAMLVLERELCRAADLHVNRALAEEHFAGWLSKVIKRDCLQAARSMRRSQRRAGRQQMTVEPASPVLPMDEIIDLCSAISKLSDECRRVLVLRVRGCGIAEILRRLQTSQTHVHRALCMALSQLRH